MDNDTKKTNRPQPYTHTVYEILCLENGKRYIGCTTDLDGRRKQHLTDLKKNQHPSPELQKDFNRYGENAFVFSGIEKSTTKDAFGREGYWIQRFRSHRSVFGYNIQTPTVCRRMNEIKPSMMPLRDPDPIFDTYKMKKGTKPGSHSTRKEFSDIAKIADAAYAEHRVYVSRGGTLSYLQFYEFFRERYGANFSKIDREPPIEPRESLENHKETVSKPSESAESS